MANYAFEGDIADITDRQLEFINNALADCGLKDSQTKVLFEPVGVAGDNYVAKVKRITLEGENGKISLIAKIAPTDEKIRMSGSTAIMFKNEHTMYTEVLPKFTQLEIAADVPEDQRLRYAKCYGSFSEQPNEVILLEDLKTSDFVMLDRFESLSDACVRSILKNFAILHSLSYALKKQEPETFNHFTTYFLDIWKLSAEIEESKLFFQYLENEVLQVLDNEKHKNLVRNKILDITNLTLKLAKVDGGSKHSVIQQGDSWTNNIMFKIKDDSAVQSIMIDYQLSKENNPTSDLLYMIFNCTDLETRTKNYYDWIDYYHTELDKALNNFGLKANFVYPRDQLDADLKRYGKLIFGLSTVLASILTRKSEDTIDFGKTAERSDGDFAQIEEAMKITSLDDQTVKRFRDRVVGLVTSCIEFGYL